MRITWNGHACFRLEGSGLVIVTDPYLPGHDTPESSGLPLIPGDPPDVVLMSSDDDAAHSWWQAVPGNPRVVNTLEHVGAPLALSESVHVMAIPAREGDDRPDNAGDPTPNAMYYLTLDGLTVCHIGDIGTPFSEQQLEALVGKVDALLALAGGGLTIDLDDLDTAIEAINPRVVIPMHFRIQGLRYDVGPLEDFLAHRKGDPVIHVDGCSVELSPNTMPVERTTIVLRPLAIESTEVVA